MKKLVILFMVFILTGCVSSTAPKHSTIQQTSNFNNIDITLDIISMTKLNKYNGFSLTVVNNNNFDVEINWDRTFYLRNGEARGNFMFEDTQHDQRYLSKTPDLISSGPTFRKKFYPNALVKRERGYSNVHWWKHYPFTPGKHGVSLSLWANGKEMRKVLEIEMKKNN